MGNCTSLKKEKRPQFVDLYPDSILQIKSVDCSNETKNQNKLEGNLQHLTLENCQGQSFTDVKFCKVLKVYDGDTYTVAFYYNGLPMKFQVRLYGVDCDEIRDNDNGKKANALRAKTYVSNLILGKIVNITILNNTNYADIGKITNDKFGRLLAKIYTLDKLNIADELIKLSLAKPYFGGTK